MHPGERLAADIIQMGEARSFSELEEIVRAIEPYYYELPAAEEDLRRAYELIKTHYAIRLASTLAA